MTKHLPLLLALALGLGALSKDAHAHKRAGKLVPGTNLKKLDAFERGILLAVQKKLGQEVTLQANEFNRMKDRTAHIAVEQKHPWFPKVVMVKNADGSRTPVGWSEIRNLLR